MNKLLKWSQFFMLTRMGDFIYFENPNSLLQKEDCLSVFESLTPKETRVVIVGAGSILRCW